MAGLGRLEKVALRDVWSSESSDFTPWLARQENIALLGEAIGLELEVEAQEKEVGPFRADILCKQTGSGTWVLIENQLERTDHGHLGQLITYAAGLEAVVVVWIAERFTEEHRAALDWLNEISSDKLRCFGLEIELWRIGESIPAPKFNIVSKPNDWSRSVSATAGRIDAGALGPAQQLQLDYWIAFNAHLQLAKSPLRPQKPSPQNWTNVALGKTGAYLTAIASTWNAETNGYDGGENRAQVTIDHPQFARSFYLQLEKQRDAIEKEFGGPLTWKTSSTTRTCTISVRRSIQLADRSAWPDQHVWLQANLEKLAAVFAPRVRALLHEEANSVSPADEAGFETTV